MIVPDLASSLVNLFKPENKNQFRRIKHLIQLRWIIFLMNGGMPVTLFSSMLTFTDSIKSFK